MEMPMEVKSLWRYPVKSLQGERLARADVGEDGIVGDRQWGIVDLDSGYVLTARREPRLLFASARLVGDDEVAVTLPDGSILNGDDELSEWLGRRVTLRRASPGRRATYETALSVDHEDTAEWTTWEGAEGTFHDSTRTMVSIVSRASLDGEDERRFRANVVVDGTGGDDGGGEDALVGTTVQLGGAVLDVVKQIDRCVVTTRPQPGGLARDLDVLRSIIRRRGGFLGVGALVREAGPIAVGDRLRPVASRSR